MKTEPKTSKADQVKALRERRAEAKERVAAALGRPLTKAPKKAAKRAAGKKAAKAKARKPTAPRAAAAPAKAVRPGSKAEIIAGLLTRKQGCTAEDIRGACDWKAVNVPRQAAQAGLSLRQEKIDGVTHYFGTAA